MKEEPRIIPIDFRRKETVIPQKPGAENERHDTLQDVISKVINPYDEPVQDNCLGRILDVIDYRDRWAVAVGKTVVVPEAITHLKERVVYKNGYTRTDLGPIPFRRSSTGADCGRPIRAWVRMPCTTVA